MDINTNEEQGLEVDARRQAWDLWKPAAKPSFSRVTSLGCSLVSPSRGWQNYLLHQSWGWANAPHRGLHFTQPAPQWPRRHSQSRWSISGMTIHHFVLLKVFDCPAQQSGAACLAILLHRWKCLTLRDLSEQLPLLPVPLQIVMTGCRKQKWDVGFCSQQRWLPKTVALLFFTSWRQQSEHCTHEEGSSDDHLCIQNIKRISASANPTK